MITWWRSGLRSIRTAPNQAQESGATVLWPSSTSHGETRCFSYVRKPCFLSLLSKLLILFPFKKERDRERKFSKSNIQTKKTMNEVKKSN